MFRRPILAAIAAISFSLGGCTCNESEPTPPAAVPDSEAQAGSGDEEAVPTEGSAEAPTGPCGGEYPDAIAFVDCNPVMTGAELQSAVDELVERYERLPDRDATTSAWRNERRRRLVRSAVQSAILELHADGRGIEVTDTDVTDQIREDLGHVFEDERLYERFLESRGSDRDTYQAEVRRQIAIDRILQERGQLEPTDEDVQSFYEQNRERWREGERVRVRAITIRLRGSASEEDVAAALVRIEALRDRVEGGEDFAEVAMAESEAADRVRGGDRGWIVSGRRRQLVEDGVEELLFSATVGELTEPIHTRLGWQFFEVLDKRPEGFRDLDEVQEILREPLRRRNRDRLSRELENELIEAMEVLYLEDRWGIEEEATGDAAPTNPGAVDGFNRPVDGE
ncbi:MAG: parvulin-like peptidyl-prolyl isomerase [Bradymonadia bacterium]|jgi:parvulin-like peptidyl-prolyl isomerase